MQHLRACVLRREVKMRGLFFFCFISMTGIFYADAYFYRHDGAHIIGGKRFAGTFNNYSDCVSLCHNMTGCLATDWDGSRSECWYHDAETACGMMVMKPSCVSLRKHTACVGDPPPQLYYRYNGYHIRGGTQYTGTFNSFVSCTRMCDGMPDCLAADWNADSKTCWLHTLLTGCGGLTAKEQCTTFRKATACKGVVKTTTVAPSSSTSIKTSAKNLPAYYQYQQICSSVCIHDSNCYYVCMHYIAYFFGISP